MSNKQRDPVVPENPTDRHEHLRAGIDLADPYEVRYWTGAFGVSVSALQNAVAHVGTNATLVRQYLGIWRAGERVTHRS